MQSAIESFLTIKKKKKAIEFECNEVRKTLSLKLDKALDGERRGDVKKVERELQRDDGEGRGAGGAEGEEKKTHKSPDRMNAEIESNALEGSLSARRRGRSKSVKPNTWQK